MKNFLFCICLVFILSGCFSLKTSLPQVNYYDLSFAVDSSKECKMKSSVGISEIRSSPIYDRSEMIYRTNQSKIISLSQMQWIDSPKNLFRQFLLKRFKSSCIRTSIPPFGGVKNDYLLKIELLNFEIEQDNQNAEFAYIGFFYELLNLKSFSVLESGIIEKKEKVTNGYVSAFKKVMQEAGNKLVEKLKIRAL